MFKKPLFLLLTAGSILMLTYTACKKTEVTPESEVPVEKKNTSLMIKFTGTNCYYCGNIGWDLQEALIKEHHGKDAVCLSAYSKNYFGEFLISDIATAYDEKMPGNSYPTFGANFKANIYASNVQEENLKMARNYIDSHSNSKVIANSATFVKTDASNITVNVHSKFFEASEGEYNIAILVIEDGVIAYQNGNSAGNKASHHKVLRAGNGNWGQSLAKGNIAANSAFDHEIKIPKDPSWNMDKIEVVSIIWKKKGSNWDFVNAHLHVK